MKKKKVFEYYFTCTSKVSLVDVGKGCWNNIIQKRDWYTVSPYNYTENKIHTCKHDKI